MKILNATKVLCVTAILLLPNLSGAADYRGQSFEHILVSEVRLYDHSKEVNGFLFCGTTDLVACSTNAKLFLPGVARYDLPDLREFFNNCLAFPDLAPRYERAQELNNNVCVHSGATGADEYFQILTDQSPFGLFRVELRKPVSSVVLERLDNPFPIRLQDQNLLDFVNQRLRGNSPSQ